MSPTITATNPEVPPPEKAAAPKVSAKIPARFIGANNNHLIEQGLTANSALDQHDRQHVHGARPPPAVRLLSKAEVLATAGVTYPTIRLWMRNGTFPRSPIVGGKSKWRSDEVATWLASLPVRPLKGDAAEAVA